MVDVVIWLASKAGALVHRVRTHINHPWIWVYDWASSQWKQVSSWSY